jgi:hypothetical protein
MNFWILIIWVSTTPMTFEFYDQATYLQAGHDFGGKDPWHCVEMKP